MLKLICAFFLLHITQAKGIDPDSLEYIIHIIAWVLGSEREFSVKGTENMVGHAFF